MRGTPDAPVISWLDQQTERLFIPVVSVAELVAGVAKLKRNGSQHRAVLLETWVTELIATYGDRVVTFDVAAASATGRLLDDARAAGRSPGFADLAIAGIALANDLTVLTRNLRHFAPLGVPAHDPYASLPS